MERDIARKTGGSREMPDSENGFMEPPSGGGEVHTLPREFLRFLFYVFAPNSYCCHTHGLYV